MGYFEMPTHCAICGEIFDLNDGRTSDKWRVDTTICNECWGKEQIEIEDDERWESLNMELSDALYDFKDCHSMINYDNMCLINEIAGSYDYPKTLNQLRDEIHEYAISKGFWDNQRETGTLLMLCVSELAEAMEADRKGRENMLKVFDRDMGFARLDYEDFDPANSNYAWIINRFETTIKDTFEDELADTIIRILDLCGAKGIDIEKHIELKIKYNASREKMHGKKY
jgi:NTP pyrophosphatase (non-canonical NTP hydrolase)